MRDKIGGLASALIGGGEMGQLVRDTDWSATPLGDYGSWPQSLRSSLSLVLNTKGIAALYWGPQQWLLYNDAYGMALGDRHPAAFGKPMPEVLPDIAPVLAPQVAEVLRTGVGFAIETLPMTMRRHGRDEETIWTYSYSPVQGEEGAFAGVLLLATEVTKQVQAERGRDLALAELARLNDSLEYQISERTQERDRIWQVSTDMLGVADDQGVWLAINPAWTSVLGWQPDEIIGRTSEWMEHPDDQVKTRTEVGKLAAGGSTFEFENRFRTKNGDYRTLTWAAVPTERRLYCVARDVTERMEAERRLQASQARQHVVFGLTRQLMGITKLDGTVLEANPAALDAIGADLVDVLGQPFWATPWFAATPGTDDIVREGIEAACGGQSIRTELPLVLPNGETRIYDFGMHPVRNPDGLVIEIMPEATDITELRAAEEALRQSQKMEAVGQLTGGLAHDFNNLLTGMMGNLELLQMRVARGRLDDLDRFINAAQGAGRRAASLTQRLLAFSRRQTLDPKPTDVNRLIAGLDDMLRRTVGASIDIEVVSAAGLWNACIDSSQLENAVLNLCINGRDAMPEGGKLTIETANKWIDDRTGRERDLPPGQYISICVTDTGTGMSPKTIEQAFEPFFTTKPIGQGTGLGLSMIYGFARQSGGQVRIYSEMGQGTTVYVYLPRYYGEAAEQIDPQSRDQETRGIGQTILVVDDEATIRHLIDEVLDEVGYTVIGAADGAAGIKVLQSGAKIEMLITDVGLPNGMNGRQVADAARVLRPGLKVLFITGFAENAAVGNGHLEPGMDLLTKPFSLDALTTKVAEMLRTPAQQL